MKDYRASRDVADAIADICERLAKARYELETVKDLEAASRVIRGIEEAMNALSARIVVPASREGSDDSSRSSTRP